jgi:hypothetical protein
LGTVVLIPTPVFLRDRPQGLHQHKLAAYGFVGGAGGGVLRKAKEKRGKERGERKVGSERRKE